MRANEVENFDDDLRQLVRRMKDLMQDANGVGLAGTQVGTLQRVFVFQPEGEDEAPRALVNPVLTATSEVTIGDTEGCLSMQGVTIPVERPVKVTIEGKDENGEDVRLELEERDARVVQHELDHLDGILILDRTTPEGRREALGILRPEPLLGAVT
jgi:peptide deformylase